MSEASSRSEAIEGSLYNGTSSQGIPARLVRQADRLWLDVDGATDHHDREQPVNWHQLTIAPRVGNTPRYLYLPGDRVFETADNDGVDHLARHFRQGLTARLVHRLENHLGLILVATLVTTLLTVLTFTHGIPWVARTVAWALPEATTHTLAEDTLTQLDEFWLEPSSLSEARQEALRDAFRPLLATEPDHDFTILFRDGMGANAFALPDGTLVFSDEMVALAETDEELATVLAHEMGHVVHRHGLQGIVQSSLSAWIVVLMTGDLSSASDLSTGVPAVMMNLAYSRNMEREADEYALQVIRDNGMDPMAFVHLMTRLDRSSQAPVSHDQAEATDPEDEESGWGQHLAGLFSTHPMTSERIDRFRAAASR